MKRYKLSIEKESVKAIYYLFNKILSKSIIMCVLLFFIFFEGLYFVLILVWNHSTPSLTSGFSDPYLFFTLFSSIGYSLIICPFVYKSISESVFSNRLGSSVITKESFIFIIWLIFFLSTLFIWLLILVPTAIAMGFFGGWASFIFGNFIGTMFMSIFFIGLLTSVAVFIGSLPLSKIGVLSMGTLIAFLTISVSFSPNRFGIPEEWDLPILSTLWKIIIVINPLSFFGGILRFFPLHISDIAWYWYCIEVLVSILMSTLLIFGAIKIHRW